MIAICDAESGCKQTFNVEKLEIAKVKGEIEKTFFTCPNCNMEYIAFYTDKATRKLQKKLTNERSQFHIDQLRKKIKRNMEDLKNQYGKQ